MATKKRGKGLDPYQRAVQQPRSLALAIRAKCWDCEGQGADPGWQRRVRTCIVTDCPLWHVRPYRKGIGREEGDRSGKAPAGASLSEGRETVKPVVTPAGRGR
jgi:hypothetical protein